MSEREQFESWFQPRQVAMKKNGIGLISINRLKQRQWEAWQASREALKAEHEPIGEVQLGEHDDTGSHPDARVVCLHDQADWENFPEGTKLYLNPLPYPPSNHPIDTTSQQYEALSRD